MNDYIAAAVIAVILILAIGYIIRSKRKGIKCIGCPSNDCCGNCNCCGKNVEQ
jgi:hypothetical protein